MAVGRCMMDMVQNFEEFHGRRITHCGINSCLIRLSLTLDREVAGSGEEAGALKEDEEGSRRKLVGLASKPLLSYWFKMTRITTIMMVPIRKAVQFINTSTNNISQASTTYNHQQYHEQHLPVKQSEGLYWLILVAFVPQVSLGNDNLWPISAPENGRSHRKGPSTPGERQLWRNIPRATRISRCKCSESNHTNTYLMIQWVLFYYGFCIRIIISSKPNISEYHVHFPSNLFNLIQ